MANPHNPVTIVTGGGNLVTPVTDGGNPVTAVVGGGNLVTLTDSGMNPVTFIGGINPTSFAVSLTYSLIPSPAVDSTYTFTRNDTDATVTDFEGLIKAVTANEARFVGARRVENLATGLVTETITVISGNEYQVTIAGGSGATCVASGAFTGTLTANGTNRISWNSGTPKTAASTSLTLAVIGTLTEMLVEDVTGQANQNPSENVAIGAEHGTNAGNVKYFNYQNNNTVDGSGVVTESQGASIAAGTLEGALVEGARTNYIRWSEALDDALWSKQLGTISVNATVAPDGRTTADKYQETTGTGNHWVFQNTFPNSFAIGTSLVLSIYAKAAERDQFVIRCGGNGMPATRSEVLYTLTGGGTSSVFNGTPDAHGIEALGNGWYRCWVVETTVAFDTVSITNILYNGSSISYAGTLNSGAYFWGCQIEEGTELTSYVPSIIAAITTRNAESLWYPNTNILDDECTLAFTFTPNGNTAQYAGGGDRALIGVRGVNNDLVHIDTTTGKLILSDGTNETVPTTLPDLVAGTATKIAIRWSATDGTMQIRQDAVEVSATFDGSMNKSTPMSLGYPGANRANGTYKNLIVYNGAVSDATFTGLTA